MLENFENARSSRKCYTFEKMLEILENAEIVEKLEIQEYARKSKSCQELLKMLEFLEKARNTRICQTI